MPTTYIESGQALLSVASNSQKGLVPASAAQSADADFHTERWDSYGTKDNLMLSSSGHGESRKILLRLTYGFGKQRFEKIDRNLEELNRL